MSHKKAVHIIQGRYSAKHGWEDLGEYTDRAAARRDLREYEIAAPYAPHRIVTRRARS